MTANPFFFFLFSFPGETSLHLAARYARVDAAKVLLDAGADPNAQDSTGRTPLHTAVAADAQGVFQVRWSSITADICYILFFFTC